MKRFTITMLALLFAMGMPMVVSAMDHSSHGMEKADEMKQHGDMEHADQGMHKGHDKVHNMDMDKGMSHDMGEEDGGFAEIGKDTQEGVVATAKVKTYDEETLASMAKMGMDATHHVMLFFTDEKSGDEITAGKVALKVQGKDAKPVMLMQMGTGFGGDVSLSEMMVTFEIGTRLEDGKKRQFSFSFHNM